MNKALSLSILFFISIFSFGQETHEHAFNRIFEFPDIPGYKTMVCDLHIHTVFSDGNVWPSIRVEEALRDSLDVLAITDHLEYQPHSDDIPHPDRNRSWEIASESAENTNLLVINGSEITRKMPPGHSNAIFIEDANKLLIDDSLAVFKEANRQGAFVFWNHPSWEGQVKNGIASMAPIHDILVKKKWLHGIEVVNEKIYSDEALQIALDHDLTIMGTSDVHNLIDWDYKVPEGGHRPVTLVFTKDRTVESLKEGLFAKRTIVYHNNMLIGREREMAPFLKFCLKASKAAYPGDLQIAYVTIQNYSDVDFLLQNKSEYSLHRLADLVRIKPHEKKLLRIKTIDKLKDFLLEFEVLNVVTAPGKHLNIQYRIITEME